MRNTGTEATVKTETGKWAVVELVSSDEIQTRRTESPRVNYHALQSLSPYEYAAYLASLNID